MKTCKTCQKTKPFSEFTSHTGKGYADGYEKHCKACLLEKRRRHVFTCKRCGEQRTGYRAQEFCGYECSAGARAGQRVFYYCECGAEKLMHSERCNECALKLMRKYNTEEERSEARKRLRLARYRVDGWERERARRLKFRQKDLARRRLQAAVYRGDVLKPNTCSHCLKQIEKWQVQGHHQDYSRPYEVVWLCDPCHKKAEGTRELSPSI